MSNELPPKVVDPNKPKRIPMPKGIPLPNPSSKTLGSAVDVGPVRDQNERLRRENEELRRKLAENAPARHTFEGGVIPAPPDLPPAEPPEVPIYGQGPYTWKGFILMRDRINSGPYVLDEYAPKLLFRTPGPHPADAAAEYCRLAGVVSTAGKVAVDLLEGPAPDASGFGAA